MRFDPPLLRAQFERRYKRFFADLLLDGIPIVAHCPNTGALLGCTTPGSAAGVAQTRNPALRLRYGWKLIFVGNTWVGIDTGLAVPLVCEAIDSGLLPALGGFERRLTEVKYGREGTSRIDLLLSRGGSLLPARAKARALPHGDERVYVEVKSTTLVRNEMAAFPDAVTARGQKHLMELMDVVHNGQRAAMVFCVLRDDCTSFTAADDIDPAYGALLRKAASAGVELYALKVRCSPEALEVVALLPIAL